MLYNAIAPLTVVAAEGVLLLGQLGVVAEVVEAKVRDLDHEARVHHAVGGLEVAVAAQVGAL